MVDGAAVMGGLVEDRPWLKSYPPGVPAEIDPLPYSSLADFFDQSCKRHAQRTAYHSLGASMTFATLHQKATAIGSYLQSLGLHAEYDHLRQHFELQVYAGLRSRGDKASAERYLVDSPVAQVFAELIAKLSVRRPRV